ncbi:unnamed protein product [Ixodes hexagonus]
MLTTAWFILVAIAIPCQAYLDDRVRLERHWTGFSPTKNEIRQESRIVPPQHQRGKTYNPDDAPAIFRRPDFRHESAVDRRLENGIAERRLTEDDTISSNEINPDHRKDSEWGSKAFTRNRGLEQSARHASRELEDTGTRKDRVTRQEIRESRSDDTRRGLRDMRRTSERRMERSVRHARSELEDSTTRDGRRTRQEILESRSGDSPQNFRDMRRTSERRMERSVQHARSNLDDSVIRNKHETRQEVLEARSEDSRRGFGEMRLADERRLERSVHHAKREFEDSRTRDELRTRQEMPERRSADSERRLERSSRGARTYIEHLKTREYRNRQEGVESRMTSDRRNHPETRSRRGSQREPRYEANVNGVRYEDRMAANYQSTENSYVSSRETVKGQRNGAVAIRRAATRVNDPNTLDIISISAIGAGKRTTETWSLGRTTERMAPNRRGERMPGSQMRFHFADDRRDDPTWDTVFHGENMRHRHEDFRTSSRPPFNEANSVGRTIVYLRRGDRLSGLRQRGQRMTERVENIQNRRFSTDPAMNEMSAKNNRLHESRLGAIERVEQHNRIRGSRQENNIIAESVSYNDLGNRRQRRSADARDDYHFMSAKVTLRASGADVDNYGKTGSEEEIVHERRTDRVSEPEFSRKYGHHRSLDMRRDDNRESTSSFDDHRFRTNSRTDYAQDRISDVRHDRQAAGTEPSRRQASLVDDRRLHFGQQPEKMNREDLVRVRLSRGLVREDRVAHHTRQKWNEDSRVHSNTGAEMVTRVEDARTVQDASHFTRRAARMVTEEVSETATRASRKSHLSGQRNINFRSPDGSLRTRRYDEVEQLGKGRDVREFRAEEATRDQRMTSRRRELGSREPREGSEPLRTEHSDRRGDDLSSSPRRESENFKSNTVERDATERIEFVMKEANRDSRQAERFAGSDDGTVLERTNHRREIGFLLNSGKRTAPTEGRQSRETIADVTLNKETSFSRPIREARRLPPSLKTTMALGSDMDGLHQHELFKDAPVITETMKEATTVSQIRHGYKPTFHEMPFILFTADKLSKWEQLISARTLDCNPQPHPHNLMQKHNLHWINNIISRAADPNSWFQTALAIGMVAWITWSPNKKTSMA